MTAMALIGRVFPAFLETIGRLVMFAGAAVRHCVTPPIYPRLILRQMLEFGYYSLPVVRLTAIFTGVGSTECTTVVRRR